MGDEFAGAAAVSAEAAGIAAAGVIPGQLVQLEVPLPALESEAAAMAKAMRDCWRFDDDHGGPGRIDPALAVATTSRSTSWLLEVTRGSLDTCALEECTYVIMPVLAGLTAYFGVDVGTTMVAMLGCVSESLFRLGPAGVAREIIPDVPTPCWLQHLPASASAPFNFAAPRAPPGMTATLAVSREAVIGALDREPELFRALAVERIGHLAVYVADPLAAPGLESDYGLVSTLNAARTSLMREYYTTVFVPEDSDASRLVPFPGPAQCTSPPLIASMSVVTWQNRLREAIRDGDMYITRTIHVVAEYVLCSPSCRIHVCVQLYRYLCSPTDGWLCCFCTTETVPRLPKFPGVFSGPRMSRSVTS